MNQNNLITITDSVNVQMPIEMLYLELGKKEMIIKALSARIGQLEAELKTKEAPKE